ncbi:MAG: hypothetical protein GX557_08835, partial [Chloroflexi bacterium]|nr:hypothetical protein [Chloroflexota bacterium]
NVVFLVHDDAHYAPFVHAMLAYLPSTPLDLVYVRADGRFDAVAACIERRRNVDLAALPADRQPLEALYEALRAIGAHAYTLFDPLEAYAPWFTDEADRGRFFTRICPLLFELRSVAYWGLAAPRYSTNTIAAIRDCTQIFVKVDPLDQDLLITPQKVWGRYSETMFRPHHLTAQGHRLSIAPLPMDSDLQHEYIRALADKNRELAEIRDALQQRNRQLAELNERLAEQSRLYQSLRNNLDHLLALFQTAQAIGSSLAEEQVRLALVAGAVRLFDTAACRLALSGASEYAEGMTVALHARAARPELAALRSEVCASRQCRARAFDGPDEAPGSAALAPIVVRGECLGTLELYAHDTRLTSDEALTLLSYLASEASIALDNAHLYREIELQGQQLRSYVETIIISEEQDSRQLAFDLHDTLVQTIVAAYQHLQSAQAWRERDPQAEGRELDQGVQLLQRAIYEARRLIGQLRPAGLDDLGLVQALRLYIAQLTAEANWQVELQVDPSWPSLSPTLEAALFRIIQEATHNAQKYAQAARVQVRLEVSAEHLSVTIRDWGKGFDPDAVPSEPQRGLHMGLVGIRERARMWEGDCTIRSAPGRGTTIRVRIPRRRALPASEGQA